MINNFAKKALDAGGSIHPLIIPSEVAGGTGLMNPSILVDNGKIIVVIRNVNYTIYHSEKKVFPHQWGPLTYLHPENDLHLRTTNYYCELDENLDITRYTKIDMSKFDTYEPQWDFVGLEDVRLVRWDGKLYISGVRRDTTTNGQGRMELSEIEVTDTEVKEISRFRIPPPNGQDSYCEKNWMPVLDMPYHYVKWTNPTEVVQVDPETQSCKTVVMKSYLNLNSCDLRGGSQVLSYGDKYLTMIHEVRLFNSLLGRKDAKYFHGLVLWDKDWNILKYSGIFNMMDAHIEFCAGMAFHKGNFLIPFAFQDNAAFILKVPEKTLMELLT